MERYADTPSRDMEFSESLACHSLHIAGLLCRLGQPTEGLRLAEQGMRLYQGLRRATPAVPRYGHGLSSAWERIAKARWELGQRDEALAAFRKSAAVQREVVAQAPSVRLYRLSLSRCYDRLAHWGGLVGDRATVVAALLEREKLWPNDPDKLMKVADDFRDLAEAVAKGQEQLSPNAQVEWKRYLAESDRVRRAAEAAQQAARRRQQ